MGRRDKLGVWDQEIKTIIYKILHTHTYTPYSTGNYIQYLVITHNETVHGEEYVRIT